MCFACCPKTFFYFSGFRSTFYTRFIGVLTPSDPSLEPVLIASFIDRQLIENRHVVSDLVQKGGHLGPGQ